MKQFCLFSFIISLSITSFAQQWNKVGLNLESTCVKLYSDTVSDNLIISGYFVEYQGETVNGLLKWDGFAFSSLNGIELYDYYDIIRYKDTLFGCGTYDINGTFKMFSWFDETDSTWKGVPEFENNYLGGLVINGLVQYNGELILVGNYKWASPTKENIVAFNGHNFNPILNDFEFGSYMYGGISYKNDFYLFGRFDTIESKRIVNIAKWDGITWDSAAVNDISTYLITSMGIFRDTLYAGTYEGRLYKLNSDEWILVAVGDERISSFKEVEDRLYIGGYFNKIDNKTVNRICYYDGTSFHNMENGVDNGVVSIEGYHDDIFIGGWFELAGNVDANYIARWGLPIGVEEREQEINGISLYPNPTLGLVVIEMNEISSPEISIYNSMGMLVFNHSYKDVDKIDLDLHLTSGIYFVKVNVDGSVSDHKLLIE